MLVAGGAVVVAILVYRAGGGGEESRGGDEHSTPTSELAARMAEPWPDVQRANGHFRSVVGGGTRYGEAVLGYALIEAGLNAGDSRLIGSGLRGLARAASRAHLHSRPSVFETLAIAGGYNLGRRRLAGEVLFQRARPRLEAFLRRERLVRLPATEHYGNHWLVEAVAVREMLRTGVRSNDPLAVVGGARAQADELSADLLNRRIPAMAARRGVRVGGTRAYVLSDPTDDPPAYQGLSLGLYARGLRLLGKRAVPAARRTLLEIANASLWLTAPDGDLAYYGRNQEQAWALAGTVYGAEEAAALAESGPVADARYRALAARALERLRDRHGVGHFGLYITPGVRGGRTAGARGVDGSAGGPSFAGLTLALVNWTVPLARADAPRGAALPSDSPGVAVLGRGDGKVAVVRTGRLWLAVRTSTSGIHPDDLRYDFGLVALKASVRGRWRDVLPVRPISEGSPDSAGPVLRTGGALAFPFGSRVSARSSGTVTVEGGFRGPPTVTKRVLRRFDQKRVVRALDSIPGPVVRTGVRFRFDPVGCGVRISFPALAGDAFEHSVFFRQGRNRPRSGPLGVSAGGLRASFSQPATVSLEPGYASGTDPRLVRARIRFAPLAPGEIALTLCLRGR